MACSVSNVGIPGSINAALSLGHIKLAPYVVGITFRVFDNVVHGNCIDMFFLHNGVQYSVLPEHIDLAVVQKRAPAKGLVLHMSLLRVVVPAAKWNVHLYCRSFFLPAAFTPFPRGTRFVELSHSQVPLQIGLCTVSSARDTRVSPSKPELKQLTHIWR